MNKILFICHGNICRSPMAEYIFLNILRENGTEDLFEVSSMATSREEIGNDIYPPAKRILTEHGIPFDRRRATQVREQDMEYYDLIVVMDQNNINNLRRMFGDRYAAKTRPLLSFAGELGAVSDPWYTDDFETAYCDIDRGCRALYEQLIGN